MPTTRVKKAAEVADTYTGGAAGIGVDSDTNTLVINGNGTKHTMVDLDSTQTISGDKTFTGTVVMSGAVTKTEFADGTAALPSITFSDDLNSGIYRIGADNIGIALNGAVEVNLTTTAVSPGASDGSALGTTALMWSDLFLASGGVVNFNNGDVTLTHAADKLTIAGGVLDIVGATAGATTAALLAGGGTSATPCATSTADKNFLGFWTKTTATSGDSRGLYLRTYFSGAGVSGEAARIFGTVDNVTAAVGGTVNGAHISLSITGASGAVSGQGFAARLTLGADAQTRTLNANVAVLNLDSDIATGNTVPADLAFARVTDTGAVRIGSLLKMPNISNGTIFAAHTTQVMSHSIKIVSDDGTAYYIMCTNSATNRS